MPLIQPPKKTLATDNNKWYEVLLAQKEDVSLCELPNFSHMLKKSTNCFCYYYHLTEAQYKEKRQLQREKLHQETHNKYYNLFNDEIDIDNLNDDLQIDEYMETH